jgi:hypothetical protein
MDDATLDIKEMVKERGNTCISVIVPTHRIGQDRQGDALEVQRAISAAKHALMGRQADFLPALDDLFQTIDFKRNQEGIGIFVSPHIKKLVQFSFPVTKKVVVDGFFHLHDILYAENYKTPYYLLDISRKEVHLFKGVMDHLEEIKDNYFPKEIVEEYEYHKPSPSASATGYAHLKDVEKDKSILHQIRMKRMFQTVDKSLSKYIVRKDIPLLLCGPEKDISTYKSVTDHLGNVVAAIGDNYKGTAVHDLELLAWPQIRQFLDEQKLKLVGDFKEKYGEKMGVCGVQDVWTAAKDGRGLVVLVERDYGKAAFVTGDNKLYAHHPDEKAVRYPDVINEIMTTILEKGGRVVIVEKDTLQNYKRIALITRY